MVFVKPLGVFRRAGFGRAGVGEAVQEPGAAVQLDQHGRDRGERHKSGQLVLQLGSLGRDVFGREPRNDQVAVFVEPHWPFTAGQHLFQLAQSCAQLGLDMLQGRRRVGRNADQPGAHGKLYHFTAPAKDRFAALLKDDPTSAEEFRSTLRNYTRAYAFLAQVIPYHDAELERLYLYGKALLQRLTRTHDGGVDLGSVDLSHLRIVKTGTSDVSLGEGGEEQIVPGFTGGGRGSQTTPELALIDQVIAAINERLGGNLTDADKVWVQQSFEYAAEDPQIQQAAQANTEDNFAYVFNPAFQGLVLDRHDANADLISRVFKDAATTDFFTELARRVVYEMARDAG